MYRWYRRTPTEPPPGEYTCEEHEPPHRRPDREANSNVGNTLREIQETPPGTVCSCTRCPTIVSWQRQEQFWLQIDADRREGGALLEKLDPTTSLLDRP